jgi:hypothetical protein
MGEMPHKSKHHTMGHCHYHLGAIHGQTQQNTGGQNNEQKGGIGEHQGIHFSMRRTHFTAQAWVGHSQPD